MVAWAAIPGEGELIVEAFDPGHAPTDDLPALWRQVGELIARGQSRSDARFDRLEADVAGSKADVAGSKADVAGLKTDVAGLKTDVAGLKTDVAGLKTDVAGLKTDVAETRNQLGRLERATETRFNRVDAQLERLITLVQRAETKRS